MAQTVLIVDDEEFVRESLAAILDDAGFTVVTASSASEARERASECGPHVVVTDLRMPETTGIELLEALRADGIAAPTIVVTGAGSIDDAVAAMKAGAFDFLLKPIEPDQLLVQIDRAIEHHRLLDEVGYLRRVSRDKPLARTLVGGSSTLETIRHAIAQVAATDVPVLITGESGTGKEVAAEMIHTQSPRRSAPFVTVNCAAIPETLFESECFGHVRGAFSGATADRTGRFAEAENGTLFLDEIGTLDVGLQAKLLRVLETGEYQVVGDSKTRKAAVRVVAATNEDLSAAVEAGTFRSDLYFRLNVFPIELPPLREHSEDLPDIARELAERSRGTWREGGVPFELSDDAVQLLRSYHWPGNVRELRNVVERATILGHGQIPSAALLRQILEPSFQVNPETAREIGGPDGLSLRDNLDRVERQLVEEALARANGVKKEAARLLGIDPRNLAYYLRKHDLSDRDERPTS